MLKSEPEQSYRRLFTDFLFILDIICCIWFMAEFLLRLISSPNRASFILQMMNVIDLITIIPYFLLFHKGRENYLEVSDYVEYISVVRLFRLFRFFRLSTGLQILKHTLIASSKELLLLLLLLGIPVAICAAIVYYCERQVNIYLIILFGSSLVMTYIIG